MKAERELRYVILILALAGIIFTSSCIQEELPELPEEEIAFSYLRCSDYKLPEYAVSGNIYYVNNADPKVSDNNDGLSSSYVSGMHGPWATIQKAARTMTAGDITYIRAGTYKEANIQFRNSGTEDAPITLSAYGSPGSFEQVIIDGTGQPAYSIGIGLKESQSNIIIQGLSIQKMPESGIVSDEYVSEHSKNIVIREVIVRNNGYAGLYLSALDGFKIDSVIAYGNGYDGISIAGSENGNLYSKNGYIVKSQSYNNGAEPNAHGIAINQGHTIAICNCTAYRNTNHGFDVSDWPKGGKVSYNIAFEDSISYDNGNAGFAANSDSHHLLYLRNLAYGNKEWTGFIGYEGVGHVEYYHNVAIRNRYGGFWIEEPYAVYADPGDNTIILKNNIAYNNDLIDLYAPGLVVEGNNYEVVATHNNWQVPDGQDFEDFGNIAAAIGKTTYSPLDIDELGEGSLSTNPEFIDGDSKIPDIHLTATSKMIDSGTIITINEKSESYSGTAPDIGAYEYFRINSSGFIPKHVS